jgi:hypothetical protein
LTQPVIDRLDAGKPSGVVQIAQRRRINGGKQRMQRRAPGGGRRAGIRIARKIGHGQQRVLFGSGQPGHRQLARQRIARRHILPGKPLFNPKIVQLIALRRPGDVGRIGRRFQYRGICGDALKLQRAGIRARFNGAGRKPAQRAAVRMGA